MNATSNSILVARTHKHGRWGWREATAADVAAVEVATAEDVMVNGDVCALYSVRADLETLSYPATTLARLGYGGLIWESRRWADVQRAR